MTLALAFDCSGARLDAAIVRARSPRAVQCLAHCTEDLERGHAARLLPFLGKCLEAAGTPLDAIGLLAVTIGPGSFTGVRIGLATARGLALATGLPLAGYSTFDVLLAAAASAGGQTTATIAAIDTKRGDFYIRIAGEPGPGFVSDAAALAKRLSGGAAHLIGDGACRLRDQLGALGLPTATDCQLRAPDAEHLARLALAEGAETWRERNRDRGLPVPLYLRDAAVTLADGTRTSA